MHCGLCGDMNTEVRPINIGQLDIEDVASSLIMPVSKGDYYACRKCVDQLNAY